MGPIYIIFSVITAIFSKPKQMLTVLLIALTVGVLGSLGHLSSSGGIGVYFLAMPLLPFWAIWFAVYWYGKHKKTKATNEKEERERQATDPNIPAYLQSLDKHGYIFGEKNGRIIRRSEYPGSGKDGHILVVGGSGSGKSSALAIPSLLSWHGRVFAVDIKGELYGATKGKRKKIKVFNPQPQDKDGTFGYDPFEALRWSDNPVQEAQAIAFALIPDQPAVQIDPFWITSARDLFAGAILHYYHEGDTFTNR